MSIVTKQLYRPYQSPYESNLADPADPVFSLRPVTNGGLLFRLGRIRMEMPGSLGVVIDRPVDYRLILSKFRQWVGIRNGGIQSIGASAPVFFHRPDEMEAIDVPVLDNRVVRIGYEDYFLKHPELRGTYEVVLTVEYVEMCPEVEAIDDPALRKRIYDDLALSGFGIMEVDLDKYNDDPGYSAALETARRLDRARIPIKKRYLEPDVAKAADKTAKQS